MNLKTGRAWAIKEGLRESWRKPTREEALSFENFKTAIFSQCGRLQLCPVTHGNPG